MGKEDDFYKYFSRQFFKKILQKKKKNTLKLCSVLFILFFFKRKRKLEGTEDELLNNHVTSTISKRNNISNYLKFDKTFHTKGFTKILNQ